MSCTSIWDATALLKEFCPAVERRDGNKAFVELGFAPERTAKIPAKEGAHLKKQPAFKRHLG
ncbi:MAG: hypothetical protein GEV13_00690 [Rhodospirillales bacterium]|nr:hypothetical protein [Rhodospirillales bacterium]